VPVLRRGRAVLAETLPELPQDRGGPGLGRVPFVWTLPVAAPSGRDWYRGIRRRGSSRGRDCRAATAPNPGRRRSSAAARRRAYATPRGPGASVGRSVLGLRRTAPGRRPVLHDLRDDGRRLTYLGRAFRGSPKIRPRRGPLPPHLASYCG
jgi:hypothetical protein